MARKITYEGIQNGGKLKLPAIFMFERGFKCLYAFHVQQNQMAEYKITQGENGGLTVNQIPDEFVEGSFLAGIQITDDLEDGEVLQYDANTNKWVTQTINIETTGGVERNSRNQVSSDVSTNTNDYYIGVDTSSGSYTVTLSSSDATDGRTIVIHDDGSNASGNPITVNTEGSETISGANYGSDLSTVTLNTDNESVTLRANNNGNWFVV